MTLPLPGLELPVPLAAAIVLATIAVVIYAVRAYGRRQRRHHRGHRRAVAALVRRFLDGGAPAGELAQATEAVDGGTFWTVIESPALRLDRGEWLRLSRALVRSRHAAAERRALADDSPWRRVLATRRLALLRSRASWRALRRAMVRGPEMVTLAAAMALARYRDRGALRWVLARPERIGRRHRAARLALLRAFGRAALPDLVAALERGVTDRTLELALVDAIGLGGARDARPVLEERLAAADLDLRAAAARALGQVQAIECASSLIGALKDDAWQVRAQAARALGRMRAPLAVPALAARLTDPSWWVRRHAAYALIELGEDGQAALRHAVESSPDPYARDMAREALAGGVTRLIA